MEENFANPNNTNVGNNKSRYFILWIVALLCIFLILHFLFFRNKYEEMPIGDGYVYTQMTEWQIPLDFPPDVFLFDKTEAEYIRGEDTIVNQGERHKIVEFYLKNAKPEELFNLYKTKLTDEINQWSIVSENQGSDLLSIVFSRGGNLLNVNILPRESGSILSLVHIIIE